MTLAVWPFACLFVTLVVGTVHGLFARKEEEERQQNSESSNIDTSLYPSSCEGLSDGYHNLKLLDGDNYPIVRLKCSNNYMVLDYSVDSNIESYFSSFDEWYDSFYGPSNDERIDWKQWFLPSRLASESPNGLNYEFLVSPDCNICDNEAEMNSYYGGLSSYWMSGNLFGCFWSVKGSPNLEQNWDSQTCFFYSGTSAYSVGISRDEDKTEMDDYGETAFTGSDLTGTCTHAVRNADYYVTQIHSECASDITSHAQSKPSIGTNGKYCVCAKPSEIHYYQAKTMPINDINDLSNVKEEDMDQKEGISSEEEIKVVELWQKDFERGSYRILEEGTYKIMENIEFNFIGNNFDGLSIDDLYLHPNSNSYYWPSLNDNLNNEYPGAGEFKGPFSQGWFCGISIETDNVILDLNNFELKQSLIFYYQQRWFTTIEIGSQYFIPGQGPYNAGATPSFSKNVVIKNGILGLSSHHGIHGNGNKNLLIENIQIKEFETHGIQLNGFENIKLIDVEIGPTSDKVFLNGRYAHGRTLIPRYRELAELDSENDELTKVQFYGRNEEVTMYDIVNELEKELDYSLNYALDLAQNSENINKMNKNDLEEDESYQKAMSTFINNLEESIDNEGFGVPLGSAQYGIFLNTYGASILTYNLYIGLKSYDAYLENIKIHGMKHNMYYVHPWLSDNGPAIGPLNMVFDGESLFNNFEDWDNNDYGLTYKGTILTDAAILSEQISSDFSLLSVQLVDSIFTKFAFGSYDISLKTKVAMICNSDTMIHTGKGTQGLRLDGVENVYIKNIEIYDNHDYTHLENTLCDATTREYNMCLHDINGFNPNNCDLNVTVGVNYVPHVFQNEPMQRGFSGNMNQGININAATNVVIEDVYISDLSSKTGPVFGISIWPADDIILQGDIRINNLIAGYGVEKDRFGYNDRPNYAAEVCAVRNYQAYKDYISKVNYKDANLEANCLQGNIGCLGSNEDKTNVFDTDSVTQNECSFSHYLKQDYNNRHIMNEKNENDNINASSMMSIGKIGSIAGILVVFILFGLYVIINYKKNGVKKIQIKSYNGDTNDEESYLYADNIDVVSQQCENSPLLYK